MLLEKYNVPGPRYTSYPTVPYWKEAPTAAQWLEGVKRTLGESQPAVYIHIPFCERLCTYCGCNTRVTRSHAVAAPYIETLLQEWQLYQLGSLRPGELHLGGGTPTFLSASELDSLMHGLLGSASAPTELYSVEADPRVTSIEQLETLSRWGFRRLSLGIQDFDPQVQAIVNRVQSEAQVRTVVEGARSLGYSSINFDLIYGLPLQTVQSVQETMAAIVRLRPDRIAFYAYAHVPWIKPGQRRFTEDDLPQGEAKRALYECGRALLEQAGYLEIGMDHFALPSDSLWRADADGSLHRNFMGYTTKSYEPLIGLGVSAISDAGHLFMQNDKHIESYKEKIASGQLAIMRGHILTDEDLRVRKQITALMTKLATEGPWVLERLQPFLDDGLISLGSHCQVLPKGRAFLRNICMAFDARLWENETPLLHRQGIGATTTRFSQTV